MSTLKVDTIQDQAGGNASTPDEIYSGRAKAWLKMNGVGTVSIYSSYNVSSITDIGTGEYRMNFTTAFSDASYACVSSGSESGVGGAARFINGDGNTTSYALLLTYNVTTKTDYNQSSWAIFR